MLKYELVTELISKLLNKHNITHSIMGSMGLYLHGVNTIALQVRTLLKYESYDYVTKVLDTYGISYAMVTKNENTIVIKINILNVDILLHFNYVIDANTETTIYKLEDNNICYSYSIGQYPIPVLTLDELEKTLFYC